MLNNRFDLVVPVTPDLANLFANLQRAINFRPQGRNDLGCLAAEKAEAIGSLSKLRGQDGASEYVLPVLEWVTVRSQLADLYTGTGKRDNDVLMTFWAIHQAMGADPRWQALENYRINYEKRQARIERIRRRYERDQAVLMEEWKKSKTHALSRTLRIGC